MKYRGDIDGLRAIAVVSVVLFHFNFADGGFLGVDIFFVISGYLITKLIHDGVADGTFSIPDFYARRIRRIFPALFAVYAATVLFAFLYCFSYEADFIGKALLSSVFFVSNVFFYDQSGYFDDGSSVNPLLHTWSLSVEEQFYIVLPLLLILLGIFTARIRTAVLAAIAAVSFIAACIMVDADKSAAFYLMQYRGWEFLLGSLLAIGAAPAIRTQRIADLTGLAGLIMIIVSVATMNRNLPFPGYGALAPCLGATLVIYSGASWRTPIARLLSLQPMRFVGLISYSLYLWHYPVRVMYLHLWGTLNDARAGLLIAISFVLAALSWYFVEQPFRRVRTRGAKAPIFGAALASLALMAVLAAELGTGVRIARNEPPQVTTMLNFLNYEADAAVRTGTCFITAKSGESSDYDASTCLKIAPDKRNFLLMGDSHAAHLWPGLTEIYPQINFLQATASGCLPFYKSTGQSRCTKVMDFVFNQFIPGKHLDGVILSGRWNERDIEGIKATALRLRVAGIRVIVFGPIVEYTMPLPRILALDYANLADGTASYRKPDRQELDRDFAREMQAAGIEYVSVYRTICTPECTVWLEKDNAPMQFDYGHLTIAGSRELARRIKAQILPDVATNSETVTLNGLSANGADGAPAAQ